MRKLSRFLFLIVKKVKNNKINMHAYETAYAFSSENDTCKVHLGKKRKVWWLALDSCVAFPLVPYNLVKMIAVLIDASPWIRTMHLIYFRGMHGADHFFTLLEKKKTFSHKFTCCVYPF